MHSSKKYHCDVISVYVGIIWHYSAHFHEILNLLPVFSSCNSNLRQKFIKGALTLIEMNDEDGAIPLA